MKTIVFILFLGLPLSIFAKENYNHNMSPLERPTCTRIVGSVYCGHDCSSIGGKVYCAYGWGSKCTSISGNVYCGINCESINGNVYCGDKGRALPANPAEPAK